MSAALPYRPEIDGLRAVAVLAVVLFHAKLGPFTGGYVGVDVFFVISGFLITSIVVREIKAQTFSFADFYERRIRRIFPALFVIMFAAFVAGWFLLTPKDYQDFARSAMNTSVFVSNFAFNQHAGYFAPASDTQPLLHTWSLAVEEQFYVIAPVALLLLYRLAPRQRAGIFAAIFLASLAAAEFGVRNESSWAFYLVHARAWELMVGMALALGIVPEVRSRVGAEALGLTGLGLIALAIFRYTPETAFPGLTALAPCIGAGLVISSTSQQSTLVQRVLATAPMVAIGKISYSLYLWHWPLLAFAAYAWGADFGVGERLALIVLAFILSFLTWRYVEQPARKKGSEGDRRRVFTAGSAAIALCLLAGGGILLSRGALIRLSPEARAFAAAIPPKLRDKAFCKEAPDRTPGAESYCSIGDLQQKEPSFLLWGDSHALALGETLSKAAASNGRQGLFIAKGSCPPLLGLQTLPHRAFAKCIETAAAFQKAWQMPSVRNVIIVARWGIYAEGTGNVSETNVRVRRFVEFDEDRNRAEFARLLRETVTTLAASGKAVTIFGPVPELPFNLPSEMIKDLMRGRTRDYAQPRSTFNARQAAVFPVLQEVSKIAGVRVLYPHEVLCGELLCQNVDSGQALYLDDDHLSRAGAEKLMSLIDSALSPNGSPEMTPAALR